MKNKNNLPLLLAILVFASGALASTFGNLFIPFVSAFMAALWLSDRGKRLLSYITPILTLIFSIVVGGVFLPVAVEAIALALILTLAYKLKRQKNETSLYLTVAVSLFLILSLSFIAMYLSKDYSIEGVINYFNTTVEQVRAQYVDMFEKYIASLNTSQNTIEIPTEQISLIFDSMLNSLVGLLVTVAFLISGLTLKIFTAAMRKIDPADQFIRDWRFSTPSIYAYCYYVLFIASIFISGSDPFAITVVNLYLVFMAIYAYIGAVGAIRLLSIRFRGYRPYIFLTIALLFFPSFAVQLLSLFGAYVTINENRRNDNQSETNGQGN